MATHIRANMHTSLAAWQARLKDKERRAVTRHKRLPRSRKGTGGTGGGGVVFAHRMGENHIIIIFIQFHHFVRPTVSVRAVVSQPNEQRHSFSIYIWGSVTIKGNRPHFLPASQLARHTHTHTHTHIATVLMECEDTPAPLIFLSSIKLGCWGCCVGGWLTAKCLRGTWEITVSERTTIQWKWGFYKKKEKHSKNHWTLWMASEYKHHGSKCQIVLSSTEKILTSGYSCRAA